MSADPEKPCTAFNGQTLLLSGSQAEIALAIKKAAALDDTATFLAFDDQTGRVVDFDLRGSDAEIIARLSPPTPTAPPEGQRGRGRPKLGVVAREITLLPRHWEWLATQKGGASVTLRKLVEEARRSGGQEQQTRLGQDAAYKFMAALAGDLPEFEDAIRALFAGDRPNFDIHIAGWPADIRTYASKLAFNARSHPH